MVTTKLNLSMTEPQVRQIYAKQGDTGRVLDITLDQTPEDGTLRILRPDGVEVTSEAVTGGEISESGETVSFESLTEADVTELTVGIEPIQDLSHGDPSPSNICPITGHDEVRVTDVGKNRALFSNESNPNRDGFNYTTETAQKISGTCTVGGGKFIGRYIVNLKANTNYKAVGSASWGNGIIYIYSDELWGTVVVANRQFRSSFSVSADGEYVVGVYVGSAIVGTTYTLTDFMVIEASETDTSYEPYQGSTYTTSLGQTVYGGTLNMVTGVLTVDRAFYSATWADGRNAVSLGTYTRKAYNLGVMTQYVPSKTRCNVAPFINGYSLDELHYYCYNTTAYVFLPNDTDGTTPIQIVYPLATSTTYQLTPQQIKTLVGTNNVWASSGQIVSIKFTYGGLLSELPSDATSVVGKCYCDVEQNDVSSMPFTLNVKKNERQ